MFNCYVLVSLFCVGFAILRSPVFRQKYSKLHFGTVNAMIWTKERIKSSIQGNSNFWYHLSKELLCLSMSCTLNCCTSSTFAEGSEFHQNCIRTNQMDIKSLLCSSVEICDQLYSFSSPSALVAVLFQGTKSPLPPIIHISIMRGPKHFIVIGDGPQITSKNSRIVGNPRGRGLSSPLPDEG